MDRLFVFPGFLLLKGCLKDPNKNIRHCESSDFGWTKQSHKCWTRPDPFSGIYLTSSIFTFLAKSPACIRTMDNPASHIQNIKR